MAIIRSSKPVLLRKDMDAVLQTMVDEKIGPGEKKREYVSLFASYIHRSSGFALRSYLDAIVFSLDALGLEKGDGVALSVLTPRIYLEAIKRLELNPVLLDVGEDMMISIKGLEDNIDKIKGIVYYEPICQVPRTFDPIREFSIPVLEDISESVGSSFGEEGEEPKDKKGKTGQASKEDTALTRSGRLGKIVIASSEEDDIVSTAGGAILLYDDEDTGERIKKNLGSFSSYLEMPDLNAALGVIQITKLDQMISRRRSLYREYLNATLKTKAKPFGSASNLFNPNGACYSAIVPSRVDEAKEFARKYGVSTEKTFSGAIGARYLDKVDRFPNAIPALTRAVSFPLYPFLSSMDIDTIIKVLSHLH